MNSNLCAFTSSRSLLYRRGGVKLSVTRDATWYDYIAHLIWQSPWKPNFVQHIDPSLGHLGCFPSTNLLDCTLCLLTQLPSLKKGSTDSRYQHVDRRQNDGDIPHLLWIVIVYSWDITIAVCLLICKQLRQSKVKVVLIRIPAIHYHYRSQWTIPIISIGSAA